MNDTQQTYSSPLGPAYPRTESLALRPRRRGTPVPSEAKTSTLARLGRLHSRALARFYAIWSDLPRGWWIMPSSGLGLLLMLGSGQGLSWFVGKYALTGKDFQEVLGPSLLAAAVVAAVFLWLIGRNSSRAWMICLPVALLCRELHFAGTGTGIYIALVAIGIYATRHPQQLRPFWNCKLTTCLWLGACSWYALAVSVDSGAWKFLPHSHWWSVNLEETLESGGHLAILLGVLASVLMIAPKPNALKTP